jgi:hypothetical protein
MFRKTTAPTPQARILREKWANLEPCPYGCGGKLFGVVCSSDCIPSRTAHNCADAFQEFPGLSEGADLLALAG